MSQLPYGYQPVQGIPQPQPAAKFGGLSAGEHRRALGGIMLALWIGVGVNAISAVCSTIQQVRAHQAQQRLDEAQQKLKDVFSPRKS